MVDMLIHRAGTRRLECPNCMLCGGSDYDRKYTFAPFQVVQCCECGFVYLNPRLTEDTMLRVYEGGEYFEGPGSGYQSYRAQEKALRQTYRKLLATIEKHITKKERLLEVGCGYGFLLDEARDMFRQRVGTELSVEAVSVAKRYGTSVIRGGITSIPEAEKYDLVLSNQVIEHIYNPRRFLLELRKRLVADGAIAITTPWFGGPVYQLTRKRWPSFKVPEHVGFYNHETLEKLFHEAGLSRTIKVPAPHAFPLKLLLKKVGIEVSAKFGDLSIWIPGTTICILGKQS